METQPQPHFKITKVCEYCGKDFDPLSAKAKFCSEACRNKHWYKAKGQVPAARDANGNTAKSPFPPAAVNVSPVVTGLSPQSQVIVDLLKKENDRWERAYNDERDRRRELQKKYDSLKDQHSKMEMDHRIESIENKKPSGLAGFMGNIPPEAILEHVVPVLGKVVDMFRPAAVPMAGTDGQLDTTVFSWITQLPQPHQENLLALLRVFSQMSPDQLNLTLTRITNLLKNGTTATPNYFNQASGSY